MENKLNLSNVGAVVADMDGVLWRGKEPLPGLRDFFDFLEKRPIPFILATNNAAGTPDQFIRKLAKFGINTVKPGHILTSSIAAAVYLKRKYETGTKVYVVGQEGLRARRVGSPPRPRRRGQASRAWPKRPGPYRSAGRPS